MFSISRTSVNVSQPNPPDTMSRHFIMGGMPELINTRLDPIASSGQVSGHLHSIFGGSNFGPTYDYDNLTKSDCTTAPLSIDASNYWVSPLFYHDPNNGSFTIIPATMNVYYFMRPGKNETIVAPPAGLRMVAGDPTRTSFDPNSFADQAISYMCLDPNSSHAGDPSWAERNNFFQQQCPGGLRMQVFFPQCWDGENLDSSDHKSHMAYPVENYNGGSCPSTHPVHIFGIFFEYTAQTGNFPYHGPGTWVLSTGDTIGYNFHGDFVMGWTEQGRQVLQETADTCGDLQGNLQTCPPLKAVADVSPQGGCIYPGQVVQEDIGDNNFISALPGCNPVWDGTGTKPPCPSEETTPSVGSIQVPLLDGWSPIGCIAEAENGRALAGAAYVDTTNMTQNNCAIFCASQNFKYAGVEWSQECYCGNDFSNGASSIPGAVTECNMPCKGDPYQSCGGSQRLNLIVNTGATPSSTDSTSPYSPSDGISPSQTVTAFADEGMSPTSTESLVSTTSDSAAIGTKRRAILQFETQRMKRVYVLHR
ncbi:hypothetical protein ABKN59_005563 [Abortiporus biennis]